MREEISWHQLVEWHQYYEVSPFGEERADLRAAIPGTVIANEIRAIAGGLAGKRLDAVQVSDLMIDTGKGRKAEVASTNADNNRAKAYHDRWAESLQRKLEESKRAKPVKREPKKASTKTTVKTRNR